MTMIDRGFRDELADLVADARALLDDARMRGASGLVPDAPLPRPLAEPGGQLPLGAGLLPAAPTPGARSWAALADSARRETEEAVVRGAEGLRRIREDLGDCRRCRLCTTRQNIVYGVGDPDADLAIVGEAPGRDEDMSGEPFVGAAGQMLDRMLENVLQLPRSKVHILNVVKCRPPENRKPEPDEVVQCRPFLERQIAAIAPKVILILGGTSLKALLGVDGITKRRGIWTEWRGVPTLPTFHPAYLLRTPEDKKKTFADLKLLRERYDELGGKR